MVMVLRMLGLWFEALFRTRLRRTKCFEEISDKTNGEDDGECQLEYRLVKPIIIVVARCAILVD